MAAVLLAAGLAGAGEVSELWGRTGERWTPDGRLPDFSHAGYRQGEAAIPDLPVATDVRAHGATGDGTTDDTAAFVAALAATPSGAVLVPPGTYVIRDFVVIERSGVVLRGAGPERSILRFPRPLNEVKPDWSATTTGQRTSNYSWSGGFLGIRGRETGKQLATVTAPARRGTRELQVSTTAGLTVGMEIAIGAADDETRGLTACLYAGDPGPTGKLKPLQSRQLARISAVGEGRLVLDRVLRHDLDPAWKPTVSAFAPSVTGSGIEGLRLEFPAAPYGGHFTELGNNGIAVHRGTADCWLRDLVFHNADSGVYLNGDRCTAERLVLSADRAAAKPKYGGAACIGHHGLTANGSDNLVRAFDFQANYIHDLTVEGGRSAGNVFAGGKGLDLCFDHHKKAPHANLFTDLDCGRGGRIWHCGGGADLGRQSGAWETFWNLRAAGGLQALPAGWCPLINLVGVAQPGGASRGAVWCEPQAVEPADLHAAQLAARLQRR